MPAGLLPLGAGFRPLISAVLRGLDATLDGAREAQIVAWLDLLVTWNQKIDLTAARTAEELVDLMLADALVLARHEPVGVAVVDVGSGAGAPGLALGIVRPDLALTLVEPLAKRVAFLRTVLGHLGSTAKTTPAAPRRVHRGKGEDLAVPGAAFDTAVARATLPPAEWLDLGARLTRPSGAVWVLLAREPALEASGWEIVADERYTWPLTGAERRAVRYRRTVVPPIPPG
jgi:16S rRNA (guanine527-N7)-methyltransferase